MASVDQELRSINIQSVQILEKEQDPRDFNWQTGGYLGFEVYEGSKAWYGRLPLEEHRQDWPNDGLQKNLSRFDELIKLLHPIPKNEIYPEFPPRGLTRYRPQQEGDNATRFFKAPKLGYHRAGRDNLAMRLLNEAEIHEKILHHPHRNLGSYLGCVEEEGRLVRLVFGKYSKSLEDCLQFGLPWEFTLQQCEDFMDGIEEAVAHMHSLGLAHNDISPSNIMFDDMGRAVLIDFDACAPLESCLTKGGLVGGWKGPVVGQGLQFEVSSAECDKLAIKEIRKDLAEALEKRDGM
ncbi:hypothetical protein M406DRAFT_251174 [Cryphonectria parasitica EP155]|uniref:Protein kinase domain-containing protein n=1 Tax=Cryphonectria parasitica (strain ATCC 38755 / EP155) TaxID=660469 RepID=A0A9P5CR93_CRYP1|nr:uncharacterized protein M406DRAFT_251174 [Cryphonectria parasitica EP155]KAF3768319.1 hypothetical protein M406DRAFT_251174 [Cryphonectria parasitica EP155]